MSSLVTVKEALHLIRDGSLRPETRVDFTSVEGVEAVDAIVLGEAGIDVPEELIYYDDDAVAEDESFDGNWETIDSDVEEERKYVRLNMKVDPEIKDWITANNIDINSLVAKLVEDAYRTAQLIEK